MAERSRGDIAYRDFPKGPTSTSFQTSARGCQNHVPFTNLAGSNITGSGHRTRGNNTPVALLPAPPGDYTLEIHFRVFSIEGDRYPNQGGANFKATFKVSHPTPLMVSNVNDSGAETNRIFEVDFEANATLRNLTLTGGNGGCSTNDGFGGAVISRGTLLL